MATMDRYGHRGSRDPPGSLPDHSGCWIVGGGAREEEDFMEPFINHITIVEISLKFHGGLKWEMVS
jgi:hypothetical protein